MKISAYIEPCLITSRLVAGFNSVKRHIYMNICIRQKHEMHRGPHATCAQACDGVRHTLGRSAMILRIVTPARVLSKGGMTSVPSLRMNPTFIAGPSHTYPSASTNMPCTIRNIKTTFIPLPHTYPEHAVQHITPNHIPFNFRFTCTQNILCPPYPTCHARTLPAFSRIRWLHRHALQHVKHPSHVLQTK